MLSELQEKYLQAGASFIADLPADWTEAWIYQECGEGTWRTTAYYAPRGVTHVQQFDGGDDATELLYDAWKISVANSDPWTTVVLHVASPNKVEMTFNHEVVDTETSTFRERGDAFKTQMFGDREVIGIKLSEEAIELTPEMLRNGLFG